MNDNLFLALADNMILYFCDVVRYVVEERQRIAPVSHNLLPGFADFPGDELPVRPSKVGCRRHRLPICLSFGRLKRRARKLAVGNLDAILRHRDIHLPDVVGRYLMSQAARAGVYEDAHVMKRRAEPLRFRLVIYFGNILNLDKMVAGAHGAKLVGAAGARPRRDELRIRIEQAPAGFGTPEGTSAKIVRPRSLASGAASSRVRLESSSRTPQLISYPMPPGEMIPFSASNAATPPTGKP